MIMLKPQEKRRFNLRLDVDNALNNADTILVKKQTTSSYIIQNFPPPSDITDLASSSHSKTGKQFMAGSILININQILILFSE